MSDKDKRIDAYIAKAQPFAQPILKHMRKLVHTACPKTEETVRWGFPHFDFQGEMMCSMSSFKRHCAFGFWKAPLMKDKKLTMEAKTESAMGHLGRITALNDLPSDNRMIAYIKEAAALNAQGMKIKKPRVLNVKKVLDVPKYFSEALKKHAQASATFNAFNYSNKKEYVQWVEEAKTEATRERRLAAAIEWMTDGKVRNWKYEKK